MLKPGSCRTLETLCVCVFFFLSSRAMVTATAPMATRSSLELMLDKLQQIEERRDDAPPALPARPVSRARLPRPRRPLQLDFCSESDASAALFINFLKKRDGAEKEICKIQKCYRGHRVRCCYKQLTREVVALQSFIRGENARKGYEQRCGILKAIIIIQKQGRKYIEHQATFKHLHSDTVIQTRVPYTSLVDLQKRVVKTEAKLRAKNEENVALKTQLLEIEKKWQTCEERMTFMEKEWQDQLRHIQESLAAAKINPSPQTRSSNGTKLHIPMNPNYDSVDEEDEGGDVQVCMKLRPNEELRKLKMRFKEWKKEYKNKLRDAQSTYNKVGNAENLKNQKKWWGRLSN